MDSPPSKKAKGDKATTPSVTSEKDEIQKPDPEAAKQLYKDDENEREIFPNHTRAFKLDKSKSQKSRKKEKFDQKCPRYDDIILDNMPKEFFKVKSPHIILSNKSFNKIKLNAVMLTNPRIEFEPKKRKVYYDKKWVGENVVLNKKGNITI